jgi:NTE family protein
MMREGHLHALAVTASSYGSGLHVTFYDALTDILPWTRSQRLAVRQSITVQHLLASSAIPFVFPAVALTIDDHVEYCGDGSMRQAAPISPAVHLGAERILVVGAGRMHEPPGERAGSSEYPNLAQIAGHALSNIFLDALAVDVERLRRINATLALLTPRARASTSLKPIEVLVIAPSERLDDIAAKHLGSLPLPIRAMLRGVGVSGEGDDARGAALASYLLFEAPYTRELMALGATDTYARRDEVVSFFGWGDSPPATPAADAASEAVEIE